MGTVFLVRHRETHARCVAKVIHRHLVPDEKTSDRFRLEIESLGRLHHAHIVSAQATGTTTDGRPYVVLEYLPGKTLSQLLHEETLTVPTALDYARQLLLALQAAHRAGIVHRDLKPGNILVTQGADGTHSIKVLDFGLAKVLPTAATSAPAPLMAPTTAGTIVGTPRYMSPEAASGAEVDERADLYSAALVLYKMLTGRDAFEQQGTENLLRAQASEAPPPPSHHASAPISRRLNQVVLRALAKKPKHRYRRAQDFLDALLACEEDWTGVPRGRPAWTTHRLVLVFTGTALLGVLAAWAVRVLVF